MCVLCFLVVFMLLCHFLWTNLCMCAMFQCIVEVSACAYLHSHITLWSTLFCLTILQFRSWRWSLWCAKCAHSSCCKLEKHRYCSATTTWYLAEHWHQIQWWPSCMSFIHVDRMADEKLQCREVWWTNLADVGGGCRPPCRWSKHGTGKGNSQKAHGYWYAILFIVPSMPAITSVISSVPVYSYQ